MKCPRCNSSRFKENIDTKTRICGKCGFINKLKRFKY